MKNNNKYDAIVVGGGLVGSYAAKLLSEAGKKTLLLERGPKKTHPTSYVETSEDPWDFRFRGIIESQHRQRQPLHSKLFVYTDATANSFANDIENPYTTGENSDYSWYRAYQLGGKSLQWGRMSLRFSDFDFRTNRQTKHGVDWPLRYSDLDRFYTAAERFVGVSGRAEGLGHLPDGDFLPPMEMNALELEIGEAIKQRWPDRAFTIGRVANLTKAINDRGPCIYRNKCVSGCPHGGYYSALSGAIPTALATGNLTIQCDAIVERLIYKKTSNSATGVRVIDANTNDDTEYRADHIFVCAGTLNSTRLLLNSATADGVGLGSGELGHNLMDHHMTSVTAEVAGGPDTYPLGRRPAPCLVPRFQNLGDDPEYDFVGGYGFQIVAFREDWRRNLTNSLAVGAQLKHQLMHKGNWRVHLQGFGEVLPHHDNRVELDETTQDKWGMPVLKITAKYRENETAMNRHMIETSKEILGLAGGDEPVVWTEMSKPGESIHEVGTARMGRDPETSVLDPYCRMWEASNVFVTDGSAMASSSWQNPSLTLMALTHRAVNAALA